MEPQIVTEAPKPPSQCLFSQDHDGPWIDTGLVAPWIRPYGYLGVRYVEDLARNLLGMVSKEEVEGELQAMRDQLDALKERFEEVEEFRDTLIEYDDNRRKLEKELIA